MSKLVDEQYSQVVAFLRRNLQASLIQAVCLLYVSIETAELTALLDLESIDELSGLCKQSRVDGRFVVFEAAGAGTDYQEESKIQLQILQQAVSQIESLQSVEL